MHNDSEFFPAIPATERSQQRGQVMQDLKNRREKLLAEATDCELIGNLATDDAKRTTFRRLAQQFRAIAEQLEAETDLTGDSAARADRLTHLRTMPDEDFLRQQANNCRELADSVTDTKYRPN